MRRKGNVLTVWLFESAISCCVGNTQELQVYLKEPSNQARYVKHDYEGIKVFVEKGLTLKNNQIDFRFSNIPFLKGITATGLRRF